MTNMDIVQLASIVAAICLRAARLLAVARPVLNSVLPSRYQPWVAAALVFLPELAAQVTGDRTELDLMESVLLALALLVPGGDSKDPPGPTPPRSPAIPPPPRMPTLALMFALVLSGCASTNDKPPCDSATAARMASECALRTELECVQAGLSEEECHVISECDAQAEARKAKCLQ